MAHGTEGREGGGSGGVLGAACGGVGGGLGGAAAAATLATHPVLYTGVAAAHACLVGRERCHLGVRPSHPQNKQNKYLEVQNAILSLSRYRKNI